MSILIRGMEMPTSCGDCKAFVCYRQWAGDVGDCFCGITKNDAKAKEKNAACPLIPVPPHGRLIDADALADVFRGFIAMYGSCPFSQLSFTDKARRDELQAALAEVINAPTIIPAEEGET